MLRWGLKLYEQSALTCLGSGRLYVDDVMVAFRPRVVRAAQFIALLSYNGHK